jgi:hypothetical protein
VSVPSPPERESLPSPGDEGVVAVAAFERIAAIAVGQAVVTRAADEGGVFDAIIEDSDVVVPAQSGDDDGVKVVRVEGGGRAVDPGGHVIRAGAKQFDEVVAGPAGEVEHAPLDRRSEEAPRLERFHQPGLTVDALEEVSLLQRIERGPRCGTTRLELLRRPRTGHVRGHRD